MAKFGKFDSLDAFLTSYQAAREAELRAAEAGLSLAARRQRRRRPRDVVEILATVTEVGDDDLEGDKHQHLRVVVDEIVETDPDVDQDLASCIDDHRQVFVSIRYGDRMGLAERIPNLDTGTELQLRGEWIPKEKAYAHGGERTSVLHFTHHPIGYVWVGEECYS